MFEIVKKNLLLHSWYNIWIQTVFDENYWTGGNCWHIVSLTNLTSGREISPLPHTEHRIIRWWWVLYRSLSSYSSIDTQLTVQCINNCTMWYENEELKYYVYLLLTSCLEYSGATAATNQFTACNCSERSWVSLQRRITTWHHHLHLCQTCWHTHENCMHAKQIIILFYICFI